MALTSGIFNTTLNPAELNARSFAANITRLFPNGSAPLLGITAMTPKARAKSSTHGYFSKTMTFLAFTLGTANLAADVSIDVPSTTGMTAGMVFHNPRTRENIRVTSVTDANTIAVARAAGRVAAANMLDTDELFHIGTAFAEGSNRPTARRLATVYIPNYTQIFRDAWGLTDTARASLSEAGYNNVAEDRKECALFHAINIESTIIWGQPKMDTSGAQPLHYTQGILDAMEQYAPGNTNTAASTTTYDQLVSMIEPAYQYSSDVGNPMDRIALGGSTAIRVLNDIGRNFGDVQITQNETSFGMKFQSFNFYKGSIHFKEHPLLNGLGQSDMLLILDPPALRLAYLEGRDTKPEEYGTNGKLLENGTDGVGGSLTTEAAVELTNPYGCAVIYGLTAAATA
jgi:hypothetical protein